MTDLDAKIVANAIAHRWSIPAGTPMWRVLQCLPDIPTIHDPLNIYEALRCWYSNRRLFSVVNEEATRCYD